MAKETSPRKRHRATGRYHEAIHLLNQRYHEQWQRAERLEQEVAELRRAWFGPLFAWLRWLKRAIRPIRYTGRPGTQPGELRAVPLQRVEELPGAPPGLVSIIIPFKDQLDLLRGCIRSVRRRTAHDLELVLVDNGSERAETRRYLDRARRHGLTVVDCPGPFNFSRLCNEGARQARGEYLLFLNNDTEALHDDWLDRLVRVAARPEVGVAGTTLLYPDHTIQHAGLFPRADGRWVHGYRGLPADAPGDQNELNAIRTVPAVTGACLMARRDVFDALGGFDERLPITFGDVDLCLRARHQGRLVVITPHARLLHYEAVTRGYRTDQPREEHLGAMERFPESG